MNERTSIQTQPVETQSSTTRPNGAASTLSAWDSIGAFSGLGYVLVLIGLVLSGLIETGGGSSG
ncbi:MAG: hypothetical protein AAF517_13990 [Planctomycetota bacterium]